MGRIVVGFISDLPWINSLHVANISLILCGISVMIMPLCLNYESFVSLSILFGFSSSAMVSLQSIIFIYLFWLENLTDSFAYLKLFIGSSIIAGPPFAGNTDSENEYRSPSK